MFHKLRKYITYKASIQIYKQTILPIVDYPGYLLLACDKDKKGDLQVIQNDVLRFCENKQLKDRVSIELLHENAHLVSLEQRRVRQLLIMMFKLSRNPDNIVVPNRNTRQYQKRVFCTENKIGTKYACSPYYKGTKLWNELNKTEQDIDNMYDYRTCIEKKYATFVKDFYI